MMNDYKIRKATTDDLPTIMRLIDASREIMRSNGNLTQWPVGYPAAATVKADIDDGTCYLITDNEKAIGSFALKPGPDPTYSIIYNGEWLDNTQDYYVIHRITSLPEAHGIFDTLINYSFSVCPNIRIDTHEDNTIMRKLLDKYGFTYCGIIHISNGSERVAYQRKG
jgi:hypothetical protein